MRKIHEKNRISLIKCIPIFLIILFVSACGRNPPKEVNFLKYTDNFGSVHSKKEEKLLVIGILPDVKTGLLKDIMFFDYKGKKYHTVDVQMIITSKMEMEQLVITSVPEDEYIDYIRCPSGLTIQLPRKNFGQSTQD